MFLRMQSPKQNKIPNQTIPKQNNTKTKEIKNKSTISKLRNASAPELSAPVPCKRKKDRTPEEKAAKKALKKSKKNEDGRMVFA